MDCRSFFNNGPDNGLHNGPHSLVKDLLLQFYMLVSLEFKNVVDEAQDVLCKLPSIDILFTNILNGPFSLGFHELVLGHLYWLLLRPVFHLLCQLGGKILRKQFVGSQQR